MRSFIYSFKSLWRYIVVMTVDSFRIIKSFQIFENQSVCLLVITDFKTVEPFSLSYHFRLSLSCYIVSHFYLSLSFVISNHPFFLSTCFAIYPFDSISPRQRQSQRSNPHSLLTEDCVKSCFERDKKRKR